LREGRGNGEGFGAAIMVALLESIGAALYAPENWLFWLFVHAYVRYLTVMNLRSNSAKDGQRCSTTWYSRVMFVSAS